MTKNSVSERSFLIESDEEQNDAAVEDGKRRGHGGAESGDDDDDGSDSSSPCDSPRVVAARCSQPSSYTQQWPQSYRQSIDMYSSVHSPNLSFLGTPSLSRLSNSFLTNSFRGKPPEIISSLIKPLLPTSIASVSDDHQQQHEDVRKSSHYLPPSRKASSLQRIPEDQRPMVGGHEVGPYRQCSYTQGVMNGVNVLCGVGILSTPYAVKQGGWLGLVILAVLGALAWYTGILLRRCLDSKDGLETYPDIGHAAFGTAGRIIISIILYMELYACCIEYLILESDNLSKLFPNAHLTIGSLTLDSHVLFAILTALIIMPTTWLRDLSCLSFISAGGVIASIVIVSCLFWVGLVDHVGTVKNEGTALNLPGIPIAIGLYGYCYSGHGVFPNIYSSLKKRNQFSAVLFTCIALSTVLFAGAAIMGYIMFGESTESQFTLNLPPNLVASKIAVWTTVTNPITKYALTMTPLALSLEELLPPNQQTYPNIMMLRSALVVSSLIIALSVPFFGLVMSLVGSFLTMFVAYILPCACFLSILRSKVTWYQEHFGNSASLSVGPPGLLLNGTGDLDERQFGPSRVHSGGAMSNYSAFDMGSLWTDMDPDNAEYRRNIQNRFMSNIEKMNAYGNRDLNASYIADSDLSDALSGLRLSNSPVMDQRNHGEELLDEILKRQRDFSKIGDENRSPLVGNVFRAPRSDVHPPPMYGDGILRRQTSALDGSNVSRISRHHIKGVDDLSLAEQLAIMQSGNLPRGTNLSRNAAMTNMINPMSNRYNSNTDFDLVRSRRAFLEDLLAQQYLQEDNLSYNDSRIYHDEPRVPYPRMQRSVSHFYPNSRHIVSHGDRQSRLFSLNRKAMGRNIGSQVYHDNTLANYQDVPSLDNADRNGLDSVELIDVVGRVKEVSMDQYGSRFIQQKLEIASPDVREKIFPEILSNAIALTTDVFGNYVIQKFFEFATESQLIQLADLLKGHILELSLQMYGCRVVQKVLEVVDMDRKIDIVHELKNYVLKCIGDQNGNHVIQKCIECVPEDRIPFVIDPILSQILVLCTHQYGCRVIQRALEHCHDPVTQSAIMNEIVQQTFHLTDDKFGNYVVQHVLEHGKPEERSSIIQKLSGQVVILSKQKFASNVIEKCLAFGTPEERDSLIGEIISSGQTFQELMKDQFGNYVVQRVLQTCDDKYLEMILSSIKLHLNELKNYTYGKHIVARVEKLIVTGEKRARMVSLSGQHQQPPNCTAVDAH